MAIANLRRLENFTGIPCPAPGFRDPGFDLRGHGLGVHLVSSELGWRAVAQLLDRPFPVAGLPQCYQRLAEVFDDINGPETLAPRFQRVVARTAQRGMDADALGRTEVRFDEDRHLAVLPHQAVQKLLRDAHGPNSAAVSQLLV